MELVNGHESSLALTNRGALSILDASCKFARASYFGFRKAVVNCAYGAKSMWWNLMSSDWSVRWRDVCICTDASEKSFAFAVRQRCRELASEVGRVPERRSFKRSSRSIRAKSRALRSIVPDAGLECPSSDEDVISLARRESRADFPEVSMQLLDPLERKLTAYDGFFREESLIVLAPYPRFSVAVFAFGSSPSSRVHQGPLVPTWKSSHPRRLALSQNGGENRKSHLVSGHCLPFGTKTVGHNFRGCHTKHLLCGRHGAAVHPLLSGR